MSQEMKTTPCVLMAALSFAVFAAHAQTSTPAGTLPQMGAQSALAVPLPAPATQALPANRWTPAQIREAFQLADVNGTGQLTRGEAQHLPVMPRSFEDTDLNKDGVITLEEYQASFGPR